MIEALETTRLEGMVGILHGDTGPIESIAFSPDGDMLASGSADGTARLWDVDTHQQLGSPLTANTLPVTSVGSAPTGRRSPPAATMAPCSCGMSPPTSRLVPR